MAPSAPLPASKIDGLTQLFELARLSSESLSKAEELLLEWGAVDIGEVVGLQAPEDLLPEVEDHLQLKKLEKTRFRAAIKEWNSDEKLSANVLAPGAAKDCWQVADLPTSAAAVAQSRLVERNTFLDFASYSTDVDARRTNTAPAHCKRLLSGDYNEEAAAEDFGEVKTVQSESKSPLSLERLKTYDPYDSFERDETYIEEDQTCEWRNPQDGDASGTTDNFADGQTMFLPMFPPIIQPGMMIPQVMLLPDMFLGGFEYGMPADMNYTNAAPESDAAEIEEAVLHQLSYEQSMPRSQKK